jgi:uncharacterized protein (TIGR03437 family)
MNRKADNAITRRSTLATLAGAGAAAYFIPAWNETVEAADTITCVASTPTVTEGPYWVDEKLFRSDVRMDPSTGVARAGIPMTLSITVQNLSTGSCSALAGAYVDIWHCDAKGIYSDESTYNPGGGTGNVTTSGQKFLRGYQITDSSGTVVFTTIYPGWYSGRTIHIHFRVRTYSGTSVLGNFVSQIFFDDSVNNVVMGQSAYSRTTSRDTTNSNDMVYQVANKERMLATLAGNVTDGYTAAITAGVTLTAPAASVPTISSGGVGNAVSGAVGVSAGSWTSIYGSNFSTAAKILASSDLVNNTIPTSLSGVSVQINGKAAYVQYVSPTQINVLAPADSGAGTVSVSVTNASGRSNAVTTTLQSVLPGLSVLSSYVRAVRYPDGVIINGTGDAEAGYTTSAAVGQGDIVALYGTGFGPTSSSVATGVVFTGAYATTNTVTVTIGGVPAEMLWAGLVGPGVYQINVRVPASLSDGDQLVIATVAGLSTQSTAKIKVAASAKLSARNSTGTLLARLLAPRDAARGIPPSGPFVNPSVERLMWLGGLTGAAQHSDEGSHLARVHLQTVEQQGGLIQLA